MASTLARELIPNQTIDATTEGVLNADGDNIGKLEVLSKDVNFIGHIVVTNASSPVFAAKIQHSHDGTNWFDLLSFTAVSGNVAEMVQVNNSTTHVARFIRAVLTRTSGEADFMIDLLYDRNN